MKLVVDASVAVKWVVREPETDAAHGLTSSVLLAPELLMIESANALWRRARTGEMTGDEAAERLAALTRAPVRLSSSALDAAAAFRLSVQLNHPVYDCVYLACALRNQCELVTADRRFISAVAKHASLLDSVRLLA